MSMDVITINRAPVLTLWAAIVAERLGFTHDEALTLGRAVAPGGAGGADARRPARAQQGAAYCGGERREVPLQQVQGCAGSSVGRDGVLGGLEGSRGAGLRGLWPI